MDPASVSAFSPMAAGVTPAAARRSFGAVASDVTPGSGGPQQSAPGGVCGPSVAGLSAAFPPKSLTTDPFGPDAAHAAMGDAAIGIAVSQPLRHYVVNESEPACAADPTLTREVRMAVQLPKVAAANRVREDPRVVAPLARWSAIEDRLLLGADGKGQDVVIEYANARQRAPELFPKPVVHPDLLPRDALDPSPAGGGRLGKAVNKGRSVAALLAEDSPAANAGPEARAAALAWHNAVTARMRELQHPAHRPRNKTLLQLSLEDLEALWRRCADRDGAGGASGSAMSSPKTEGSPDRGEGSPLHAAVSLTATSSIFTAAISPCLQSIGRQMGWS